MKSWRLGGKRGVVLLAAVILMTRAPSARAQVETGAANGGPRRVAKAVPRDGEITLDGRLAEAAWAAATPFGEFVQQQPVEGAPAVEPTEVRILSDDRAIYVGARMFDSEPETIARQMVRRDEEGQFDWFAVGIDPNLDRRTGYVFQVSAANVQQDEYLFDDTEADDAWDAVWSSAVHHDSLGWSVEMRIPLSQLRYEPSAAQQVWGVNFARQRLRSREETYFRLISRTQSGLVSQFGLLEGLQIGRAARRVEFRPYVLSRLSTHPVERGDPFRDGSEFNARTGLDLRYGLGSQFTLDATINPDFGQVEADPAVINLTAFETFFEERRPFFVEDAQIFDFRLSGGSNRLFYSRRVGRSPSGRGPSGASFTDIPEAATILGAAKLTGRTSGGLSIGALTALTQRERGRAFFTGTSDTTSFVVEPGTESGVFRVRQDFNDGASTIGAIGTLLHRELPADGSFDFLPRVAYGLGIDWEHQWSDRGWAFFGYVSGTRVRGDSTAMLRIQRSSNHYTQRPDSRWLETDSTATSLSGLDWRMTLEKRRGTHWTGSVWAAQVTPGFEVNDLGFSSRQEVLDGGARIRYREIQPGSWYRGYNASVSTFHNWTHDALKDPWSASSWGRAHVGGSVNLDGEVEFQNAWNIESSFTFRPEVMDRTATRGGPLMLSPRSWEASIDFGTDERKAVSVQPDVSWNWSDLGAGHEFETSVDLTIRPSSRIEIGLEPTWTRSRTAAQYVGTSTTLPYAPTFGNRYIFAELTRRELSLETRLNLVLDPHLSLQLFAQPLLSSGDFLSYRQLLRPGSFEFDTFDEGSYLETPGGAATCAGGRTCVDDEGSRYIDFDRDGVTDYTFDDRDFNVRSLIGNAVLRWEYRPGSTLFLVWQRQQENEINSGRFDFRRDVDALFGAIAENVFMIKLNYWIGL